MAINDNQKAVFRDYFKMQEELRRLKKLEAEMRGEVIEIMLNDSKDKPGTYKEDLGNGVEVSVTVPKRVEVNKELFDEMQGELQQRGLIGSEGVIQMKPSVSVTAMKYMNDEDKTRFSDLFVVKTGSPSVKFDMNKG